ncbi:hypothetical protein FOCC_FOCC011353 [Frankliniella occidentalis]|nr:hypothetical protein FOCC_FOCC011353 [Frankliniella occidentalis]
MPCPTIIMSSVTPPQATTPASQSTSPAPTSTVAFQLPVTSVSEGLRGPPSPSRPSTPGSRHASPATTPTAPLSPAPSNMHPQLSSTRRDSTTQVYTNKSSRRDSRAHASPERRHSRDQHSPVRFPRLRRQSTAIDDSCLPPGVWGEAGEGRQARRDSLSPDSASYRGGGPNAPAPQGRRDSRSHLSPDRAGAGSRDVSPVGRGRRGRLRRQSTSVAGPRAPRSPESSSTCSSRDPSPSGGRHQLTRRSSAQMSGPSPPHAPAIRRQSTTEEILIARGFRRQSTTEEMIRYPSPLYDNNHYHEECLRCNSCGLNLTGPNQKRARRFKNHILCDLHFADVALMECSDFMQQLRSFKPQSLGCAVARRKSSTTLIFPLPPQACSDEICSEYPHNLLPTPGYWIECSRQKIPNDTIWDESESEREEREEREERDRGPSADDDADDEDGRRSSCLVEEDGEDDDSYTEPPPRQKTSIEEQWEKNQCFELTSVEQETYEKYFYGTEHWNYFTSDEDLGPVVLSIKQEQINGRDQFRILVRAISYTVHGLIPASCVFADRYNREEVVRSLGKEVNINPPLMLGQLPDTPEELLKLDQVFIKSELKVGVLFVKESQHTEEEILDNNVNSPLFSEFLQVLGDRVRLKGFDKYKGGLDTVHDLTGLYSVYTNWRSIEIMFHVSTQLPYEKNDPQKLQRKRHIGNDIVCVVFLEADNTPFSPACIKSHFLHTFILVRTSPKIKRKPTRYEVSVVTRDEVGAYKPYLWEQSVFDKGPMFREWLLTKIMLEDLVANLANHAETGQIPKPYRRGSWRPIGHMRPSSPLLDSVRDRFEDYDVLAKDFNRCFLNTEANMAVNASLFDVTFLVGQSKQKVKFVGVRAILGVRSRVFQELLYGIQTGFGSPQVPVAELLARPVPPLHSPQKPKSSNFLQVPDMETPRLGNLTAGWGRSIRKQQSQLQVEDKKKWASSQDCSNKESKDRDKHQQHHQQSQSLAVPRLSVSADEKIDRAKLAQTEFNIIEFDPETFRLLLDYLHTSTCPLTCANIPGLICAAEHYDLPELLQACFHHAKQFLRIEVVCVMLCSLENYYWRYTSASELVNMILAFVETRAHQLFQTPDFLTLSESMVQMIMCRSLEVPEVRKFEAMLGWARHRIRSKTSSKMDAKLEFKMIMERLARDLKLYRISPQELIKIVLPSKAIKNERILETLMFQANSGIYRVQETDMEGYQKMLRTQESRYSDWDSFDFNL